MPIVDPSDPQVWTAQYIRRLNHPTDRFAQPIKVGYTRAGFLEARKARGRNLVRRLGILDGQNVLIIGAGFCWIGEGIKEELPNATVIGIDTSTWVQSRKNLDETDELRTAIQAVGEDPDTPKWQEFVTSHRGGARAQLPVLSEDGSTGSSRGNIKRAFGSGNPEIHWGISEDVLPWLEDAECQQLDSVGHNIATNVAHLVTPFYADKVTLTEPGPLWNWKYINEAFRTTTRANPEVDIAAVNAKEATLLTLPWYNTLFWETLLPNSTIVSVGETG